VVVVELVVAMAMVDKHMRDGSTELVVVAYPCSYYIFMYSSWWVKLVVNP
jgi:hypothetical protein